MAHSSSIDELRGRLIRFILTHSPLYKIRWLEIALRNSTVFIALQAFEPELPLDQLTKALLNFRMTRYRSLFLVFGINVYVMLSAMAPQITSLLHQFLDKITSFHTSIPISFVSAVIRGGSSSSVIK